jgi:cell division protease FtsH
VDFPKYDGRLATYRGYLGKVEHGLEPEQIEWLARNHYRGTGAEIQDIVNEALLITFRHGDGGKPSFNDFTKAMLWKRFGESEGTAENPANKRGVAVHEAGHALVMHKLRKHKERIWFASIEARGRTGGMVARSPLDDDWQEMRDDMLANVAISLASRVAEEMVLGQQGNGHGGDGPAATRLAERMVALGMGNQLSYSKERDREKFHQEREAILEEAYRLASSILGEHQTALNGLATRLFDQPTMLGTEVHELLESYGV